MDRHERGQTPSLEVEIAKLRLRVAAEKAEPARLLRQQVAQAPLGTMGSALLIGLMLGRGSRTGKQLLDAGPGVAVIGELLTMLTRASSEWRRT